jgi:hypothetical protein
MTLAQDGSVQGDVISTSSSSDLHLTKALAPHWLEHANCLPAIDPAGPATDASVDPSTPNDSPAVEPSTPSNDSPAVDPSADDARGKPGASGHC